MNFFNSNIYWKSMRALAELPAEPRYLEVSEAEKIFDGVKVCAFTGHRPEKLEMSEESEDKCVELKFKLRAEICYAISEGFTHFISGMARGTDIWAAEAVLEESFKAEEEIKLYAAVPFPEQAENWMEWEKERYEEILRFCEGVFLVSKKYRPSCMNKRNEFLVRHADQIIAVYDGKSGGTENTVFMAKKSEKNIRFITP